MTYNPGVPAAGQSPALFPTQGSDNFTRLQKIVGSNHQFNLSESGTDGMHNIIELLPQTPSGNAPGNGRLYSKLASGVMQLFYMDNSSPVKEYQITPLPTILIGTANFTGDYQIQAPVSYDYTFIGTIYINGTVNFITESGLRSGGVVSYISLGGQGSPHCLFLPAADGSLSVSNLGAAANFVWTVQIFRTT